MPGALPYRISPRRQAVADFDLLVAGGTVVTGEGRSLSDIGLRDGKVAAVLPRGSSASASRSIDATGLLVVPGFVDTHLHLMEPGDTSREDFPTGTAAAAIAGITTIVEHTHAWPVTDASRLAEKRALLRGRSHVDFGLGAHAWPDRLNEIRGLWEAGVTFVKAFTCKTHGVPAFTYGLLKGLFQEIAAAGAICLVHSEDEDLTARAEAELRQAGRSDPGILFAWRSREAEEVAVSAVGVLARATGATVVVAHASTAEVGDIVARNRASGARIVAETCPQFFYLGEGEVLEHGPFRKFTPPARIRSDHDRARMWGLFNSGGFHHLSCDHAPSTQAQKRSGDMWDAPWGLPGIDSAPSLMVDGALRGLTSMERVVDAYSASPARLYRLAGKGSLHPGADGDLALIDPSAVRTLSNDEVVSKAGWTPFAGREVRGRVVATLLRGVEIAAGGALSGPEAAGRFIPGPGAAQR
jgi:dihydroorotase (multifunctional complex type)